MDTNKPNQYSLPHDPNRELLERSELGPVLTMAYDMAINRDPRIEQVDIVAAPEDSARAFATPPWKTGTGRSRVTFPLSNIDTALKRYEDALNQVPGLREQFATMLGIEPRDVNPGLLYVQSFVHELGHGRDYMEIAAMPGGPEKFVRQRARERAALPAGNVGVSQLLSYGRFQRQAAEAQLQPNASRTGIRTFDELICAQAQGYRNTTFEKKADLFAADVLAANPMLLDMLTANNLDAYRKPAS